MTTIVDKKIINNRNITEVEAIQSLSRNGCQAMVSNKTVVMPSKGLGIRCLAYVDFLVNHKGYISVND